MRTLPLLIVPFAVTQLAGFPPVMFAVQPPPPSTGGGPGGAGAMTMPLPNHTQLRVRMPNNIVARSAGEAYLVGAGITGERNLFFGAGSELPASVGAMGGDPRFADAARRDFRLAAGSAAIDVGLGAGPAWDLSGNPRPAGRAADLGALEAVP